MDEFVYFDIHPTNAPDEVVTFKIEKIVVEGIEDAFPYAPVIDTLQFIVDEDYSIATN